MIRSPKKCYGSTPDLSSAAAVTSQPAPPTTNEGTDYNGFRAKYNQSATLADKEYFFNLPRTVSEAVAGGWRLVKRPSGVDLPELVMYCRPDDVNVCPLFISGGFVAGIQIAIPTAAIEAVQQYPARKFIKWTNVLIGNSKQNYWVSSLYFVSAAASLKSGAGPSAANGNTLQDVNIWAQDPTSNDALIRIPLKQSDLTQTLYKKENCIPSMGTHYYYKMTPQLACNDILPWFLLVKDGSVIGAGFQAFGRPQKTGVREWFEAISASAVKLAIPTAPECLVPLIQQYGVISLHVYFVDKPWTITCV